MRRHKRQRRDSSEEILKYFRRDSNDFLSRLVTTEETWLYHYDPESTEQSIEWRHSDSPRRKNIRAQNSAGKIIALTFWNQDGILLIDYLPNGQIIKEDYYLSVLM